MLNFIETIDITGKLCKYKYHKSFLWEEKLCKTG